MVARGGPAAGEQNVPCQRAMSPGDQFNERPHLLLVGDARLDAIRRAFDRAGYSVEHVQAPGALERLSPRTAAAVLAGRRAEILHLCRKIKERVPAPFLPVLALISAPARLPQEPTAPDAWVPPHTKPREIVMRVAELLRVRTADAEMVRLNAALAELAAENGMLYARARREADAAATLLRELQHRVRNNLAAIQALLVLERHRAPPRELTEAIDVALARLRSMSALQDCLAGNATDVDVRTLFTAVGRGISEVFPGPALRLMIDGDSVVSARTASSLSIIFNELLCNARRHGNASAVRLEITRTDMDVVLMMEDDGSGIPLEARDGSGWMIVRTVMRNELGGTFERESTGTGACIRLALPRELERPRREAHDRRIRPAEASQPAGT